MRFGMRRFCQLPLRNLHLRFHQIQAVENNAAHGFAHCIVFAGQCIEKTGGDIMGGCISGPTDVVQHLFAELDQQAAHNILQFVFHRFTEQRYALLQFLEIRIGGDSLFCAGPQIHRQRCAMLTMRLRCGL